MTSQKRYRHHQDGHNNRLRDLPPRFKRQKSSSSPVRPYSSAEMAENTIRSDAAATEKLNATVIPAQVAPETNSQYVQEEKLPPRLRSPKTDVLQPTQPYSPAAAWKWQQNAENAISPPWDSRQNTGLDNSQPNIISLGTNFGYRATSPPLSPWALGATAAMPRHQGMIGGTWGPSAGVAYPSPVIHGSPGYIANETQAPKQNLLHPNGQGIFWGMPVSPSSYQTSPSPPIARATPPLTMTAAEKANQGTEAESDDKRAIDYSDPDIRTIEMLRELERVADQKENENDFGVDRKSLVSHHLRMLMCAMDRYTEGIEDDLSKSPRRDEVSLSDSCGSTPAVSPDAGKMWSQGQNSKAKGIKLEASTPQRSERSEMPPVPKTSASTSCNDDGSHGSAAAFSSLPQSFPSSVSAFSSLMQPSPKLGPVSSETAAWDLWSSPTFDFCELLLNHSPEDFSFDMFGGSRINSGRERKPLYQRQPRNF